jgi:NAD(P)H-dependent FMN reductase
MPRLQIIIASTRPGRAGPTVAQWFYGYAVQHGGFEVELVDLADVNLPLLDEAAHPRLKQYEHEHTKAWSMKVEFADAFVFVTPEYNYGSPPALVNALDYLYSEWNYKPSGFVSYGGISGGLRSVQMTKGIVTTLKMMPMVEGVAIPFFTKHIDEAGVFVATEAHEKSAAQMLEELLRWTNAMATLRTMSE